MTDLDLLTVLTFSCAVGYLADDLIDAVVDVLCWCLRRWNR
jgi:hypothetical protein